MSNRTAFLDMIAFSEIGPALLAVSDNGYNVEEGSTAQNPILFTNYSEHPHIILGGVQASTAAGRYQLIARYWPPYRDLLKLPDFGPDSQDAIALQQIRESRALDDVDAGKFGEAVLKCAHIWASLPAAGYGQHENKIDRLQTAYLDAGGTLADQPTGETA